MAAKGKGGNTVAAVWEIAAPIAEQLGLSIWDIRFQKEGVSWYLRIYIDKAVSYTHLTLPTNSRV